MTLTPLERHARRRRRRREELTRWTVRAAIVLAVFGLGVALGEALHDNPKPGGLVTSSRTVPVPTGAPGSTVVP